MAATGVRPRHGIVHVNGLQAASLTENFTELPRISPGPIHFEAGGQKPPGPSGPGEAAVGAVAPMPGSPGCAAQQQGEPMRYGYFDDEHRESVIPRPDAPFPWVNYLGADE